MAHILCITSGLTGVLHASLELVSRLEADGHRVTYLSPSPVEEVLAAHGIAFEPLPPFNRDPAPLRPVYTGAFSSIRNAVSRWTSRRARLRAGAEALHLNEYARRFEALDPDLVLVDIEMHESILTVQALGLPVVLISHWFSTWKRRGLPPIKSDTIPGQGWAGSRWGIAWAWFRAGLDVRRRQLKRLVLGRIDRGDVLAHHAKRTGFPRRELQRVLFPPPFLYRTLPVISMTMESLDFPHDRRPAMQYVGPMVCAQRKDLGVDEEVERAVDHLIRQRRETGQPLIYCTVSSMDPGDTAFLEKLARVFARRPDWQLVVGLGGHIDPSTLEPLPPNISAFAWTPQLRLLEAADGSINHGGIHTINECIHFGVPMLVYSGRRHDQNGCAARVAYHGLGLRGDKEADDDQEIERKLERLLGEPSFGETMQRFHDRYVLERQESITAQLGRYLT